MLVYGSFDRFNVRNVTSILQMSDEIKKNAIAYAQLIPLTSSAIAPAFAQKGCRLRSSNVAENLFFLVSEFTSLF